MRYVILLATACLVAACTSSNTVRTSADTAIVQTRAAPVCGGAGAAKVAQKQAAVETLKAGYDRYIILGAASQNTVQATTLPGTSQTNGTVTGNTFSATTTYQPGPIIFSGGHHQSFAIKMFNDGEPYASQAIPAREVLGEDWEKALEGGALGTCL